MAREVPLFGGVLDANTLKIVVDSIDAAEPESAFGPAPVGVAPRNEVAEEIHDFFAPVREGRAILAGLLFYIDDLPPGVAPDQAKLATYRQEFERLLGSYSYGREAEFVKLLGEFSAFMAPYDPSFPRLEP
jgi:hypothetical protein